MDDVFKMNNNHKDNVLDYLQMSGNCTVVVGTSYCVVGFPDSCLSELTHHVRQCTTDKKYKD